MAKENTVWLLGIMQGLRVSKDEADYTAARFMLAVTRHLMSSLKHPREGLTKADTPLVYTQNPDIVRHIDEDGLQDGDMVLVQGTLSTIRTERAFYCPSCHKRNVQLNAVDVYVNPRFVAPFRYRLREGECAAPQCLSSIRELSETLRRASSALAMAGLRADNDRYGVLQDLAKAESLARGAAEALSEYGARPSVTRRGREIRLALTDHEMGGVLRRSSEVSNIAIVYGAVPRDIEEGDFLPADETHRAKIKAPIISNRVRRIVEDDPGQTSDRPMMVAYGALAEELRDALCKDSRLLINGSLKTHPYDKDLVCTACGKAFRRSMLATELQPYHVEYLEGCRKPQSTYFAAAEDEAGGEDEPIDERPVADGVEAGESWPQSGAWKGGEA